MNPELTPEHVNDKTMILDVRVKTDTGDVIDIELQSSSFPNLDDSFLNGLKLDQYEAVSDMLFEHKDLEDIKAFLSK